MRNNWLFFMDLDGSSRDIFPIEPLVLHNYGGHLFSQISSFVDNSIYQSRNLYAPGSIALREAFSCVSKLAGALLFWVSSTSTSNLTQDIASSSHKLSTLFLVDKILLDFALFDQKENLPPHCVLIRFQVS